MKHHVNGIADVSNRRCLNGLCMKQELSRRTFDNRIVVRSLVFSVIVTKMS